MPKTFGRKCDAVLGLAVHLCDITPCDVESIKKSSAANTLEMFQEVISFSESGAIIEKYKYKPIQNAADITITF